MSSSRMRESLGKARPPHTELDPRGGGLAKHLPLLLRGATGLGAPGPGPRQHLRARVNQEGDWATAEETGQGLTWESGVGLGFRSRKQLRAWVAGNQWSQVNGTWPKAKLIASLKQEWLNSSGTYIVAVVNPMWGWGHRGGRPSTV